MARSIQGTGASVTAHYHRQTPPKVTPTRTSAILPRRLSCHSDNNHTLPISERQHSRIQHSEHLELIMTSPWLCCDFMQLQNLAVLTGIVSVYISRQMFSERLPESFLHPSDSVLCDSKIASRRFRWCLTASAETLQGCFNLCGPVIKE